MARYSVNNYTVETLLSNIKSGNIAIPEMQRPFVWDSSKVRDLVDSLYKGFPVGYIIVWQNPDVKLKDGTKSSGKKVLIDGQQRITAMAAAIVGQEVLDDHYKWKRISIAFNPVEEKFEVANNAILKSSKWIPDIAPVLEPGLHGVVRRGNIHLKHQLTRRSLIAHQRLQFVAASQQQSRGKHEKQVSHRVVPCSVSR